MFVWLSVLLVNFTGVSRGLRRPRLPGGGRAGPRARRPRCQLHVRGRQQRAAPAERQLAPGPAFPVGWCLFKLASLDRLVPFSTLPLFSYQDLASELRSPSVSLHIPFASLWRFVFAVLFFNLPHYIAWCSLSLCNLFGSFLSFMFADKFFRIFLVSPNWCDGFLLCFPSF